jgi:hypothetical protein
MTLKVPAAHSGLTPVKRVLAKSELVEVNERMNVDDFEIGATVNTLSTPVPLTETVAMGVFGAAVVAMLIVPTTGLVSRCENDTTRESSSFAVSRLTHSNCTHSGANCAPTCPAATTVLLTNVGGVVGAVGTGTPGIGYDVVGMVAIGMVAIGMVAVGMGMVAMGTVAVGIGMVAMGTVAAGMVSVELLPGSSMLR